MMGTMVSGIKGMAAALASFCRPGGCQPPSWAAGQPLPPGVPQPGLLSDEARLLNRCASGTA